AGLPRPAFRAQAGVSVGAIVKPALGLSPAEAAVVAGELAAGGAGLVKDDELGRPWAGGGGRGGRGGGGGTRVPRRAQLDRAAARVRASDLRPPRWLRLPAPRRHGVGLRLRSRRADAAARGRLRPGRGR